MGEQLHYRRKELGLTQEEVCYGICSITYLSNLENNKLVPKSDILELICKKLGLTVKELYSNKEDDILKKINDISNLIGRKRATNIKEILLEIDEEIKNLSTPNPKLEIAFKIVQLDYYLIIRNKINAFKAKTLLEKTDMRYLDNLLKYKLIKSLGFYEYLYGSIEVSKSHYNKALELDKDQSEDDASLHYHLALINSKLMNITESFLNLEKALSIYSKILDFERVIECKLLIGINFNRIKNYEKSKESFLDIINSLDENRDKEMLSKTFHNLGYVYVLTNQHNEAIKYLEKSLNLKDNYLERLNTIYLLSYQYKKIRDIENANKWISTGIDLASNYNLSFFYKFYILQNSLLENHSSDFIEKLEVEILPYFLKSDPVIAIECLLLLAKHYSGINKYKLATNYYEKATKLIYKDKRMELLI